MDAVTVRVNDFGDDEFWTYIHNSISRTLIVDLFQPLIDFDVSDKDEYANED